MKGQVRGGLTGEESYPDWSPGGHMKTHKPNNSESRAFTEVLRWKGLGNDSYKGRVVGGEMLNSWEAGRGENGVKKPGYGSQR